MIRAAAERGWLDGERAMLESLLVLQARRRRRRPDLFRGRRGEAAEGGLISARGAALVPAPGLLRGSGGNPGAEIQGKRGGIPMRRRAPRRPLLRARNKGSIRRGRCGRNLLRSSVNACDQSRRSRLWAAALARSRQAGRVPDRVRHGARRPHQERALHARHRPGAPPPCHRTGRAEISSASPSMPASMDDLEKLSRVEGASPIENIDEPGGGKRVRLTDPDGFQVEVIHGMEQLPKIPLHAAAGQYRRGQDPAAQRALLQRRRARPVARQALRPFRRDDAAISRRRSAGTAR